MPADATRSFLGEPGSWPAARLELDEVQALWGGVRIRAWGSGRAEIVIVEKGLQAERYELDLGAAQGQRLLELAAQNDLLTIRPAERPGIPDEARPRLRLVNAAGQGFEVDKWAGVSDARFDAVAAGLRRLVALTRGREPVARGPFRFEA